MTNRPTSASGQPGGPLARVRSTMHPAGYQGGDAEHSHFEGWYVKLVSADRRHRLAVIPGIFLSEPGSRGRGDATGDGAMAPGDDSVNEAFVQVLDGQSGQSHYVPYESATFAADPHTFDVQVGPNRFSSRGMHVDLPEVGLHGTVTFEQPLRPWPVRPWSPGIMGWYAWVPRMECYHGVLSLDHGLRGSLRTSAGVVDLDGGRGYIEKDWGQAFPSAYVWMQTNHFSLPGASLTASTALIPWLTGEFRGFIVGLRIGRQLHRFTTYRQSRTTSLAIDDHSVRWSLRSIGGQRLDIVAERRRGGLLHAPVRTQMHRRVEETLDSRVHVRLRDRDGTTLFDDTGHAAGLEVHGDLERLLATR
jgi:tocopherol cyclase